MGACQGRWLPGWDRQAPTCCLAGAHLQSRSHVVGRVSNDGAGDGVNRHQRVGSRNACRWGRQFSFPSGSWLSKAGFAANLTTVVPLFIGFHVYWTSLAMKQASRILAVPNRPTTGELLYWRLFATTPMESCWCCSVRAPRGPIDACCLTEIMHAPPRCACHGRYILYCTSETTCKLVAGALFV